jgi:hypothetical protein
MSMWSWCLQCFRDFFLVPSSGVDMMSVVFAHCIYTKYQSDVPAQAMWGTLSRVRQSVMSYPATGHMGNSQLAIIIHVASC